MHVKHQIVIIAAQVEDFITSTGGITSCTDRAAYEYVNIAADLILWTCGQIAGTDD